MSALHKSLDDTLASIREHHESEIRAMQDKVMVAEVRATLLEEQLAKAVEARASAERITSKLITQFGVVEAVFAEAKALALAQVHEETQVEAGGIEISGRPQTEIKLAPPTTP